MLYSRVAIFLVTGAAFDGAGGDVVLLSGEGRLLDGGDVCIAGGRTTAAARSGGGLVFSGGEGSSSHMEDGGNGGRIELVGGEAKGQNSNDAGRDIVIHGGRAFAGYGGALQFTSGASQSASSGSLLINSADSGLTGTSESLSRS
jgi:hypothetical protein